MADLYFDQQGQVVQRSPVVFKGAAVKGTPHSDQGMNFAPLIVPFREGWAIQPHQPQHPTPEKRAGAIVSRQDGSDWLQTVLGIGANAPGWSVDAFQPRVPGKNAQRLAAALFRGEMDSQPDFIFIPPWVMATPRGTFPNNQANAAAATPSYNAGPQVGSISSMPNITAPTLLKANPGTLFAITVVVAGSQAGGVYDCNTLGAAVQATQVSPIPTTGGPLFLFEWPCQYGIVVIPGAGQVLAAKWV